MLSSAMILTNFQPYCRQYDHQNRRNSYYYKPVEAVDRGGVILL